MPESRIIKLSEDQSQAELRLIPNRHSHISSADLLALLNVEPYQQLYPLINNFDAIASKLQQLRDSDHGEEEQVFIIAERKESKIEVLVSSDHMHAELHLTAGWGCHQVSQADIYAALTQHQVQKGIDQETVLSLYKQLLQLGPGQQVSQVIARGKAPINGKDAILQRKVALARERLLTPQAQADGNVDMHDLGAISIVKPNDIIMQKIPAELGIDGYTVAGKLLSAKPGKDMRMQAGTGTQIAPHNPLLLLATIQGQVVEVGEQLQVDNVLTIKNVDVGFGNVNFKGSVIITGDVHADMKVKSTGNITVMGCVDSAELEAAGDITVNKGIVGRKIDANTLTTQISAQGQICAPFAQYSSLNANADINITRQLLHCATRTNGKLIVSDSGKRRGDLIGGTAHCEAGLTAVTIGATAGTRTIVYCATKEGDMHQALQELDINLREISDLDVRLDGRISLLPPKASWQHDPVLIAQIKQLLEQKLRVRKQRNDEQQERQQLAHDIEQYYHQHFIQVSKCIFDNVELHVGPATIVTQREYTACKVANQEDKISFDYSSPAA